MVSELSAHKHPTVVPDGGNNDDNESETCIAIEIHGIGADDLTHDELNWLKFGTAEELLPFLDEDAERINITEVDTDA